MGWLPALAERFEQQATAELSESLLHGPRHWRDVARVVNRLCSENPAADRWVALVFAAAHDSQRANDGCDAAHGERAAALVERMSRQDGWPLTSQQTTQLIEAVRDHEKGHVTDEPTVGTCWDADRLTLGRVGKRPRAELLSTATGRVLVDDLDLQAIPQGPDYEWHRIANNDCPPPQIIPCENLPFAFTPDSSTAHALGPIARCYHGTAAVLAAGLLVQGLINVGAPRRSDRRYSNPEHPDDVYITTKLGVAARYAYSMAETARREGVAPFLAGAILATSIHPRRFRRDPSVKEGWDAPTWGQHRVRGPVRFSTAYIVRFLYEGANPPPLPMEDREADREARRHQLVRLNAVVALKMALNGSIITTEQCNSLS